MQKQRRQQPAGHLLCLACPDNCCPTTARCPAPPAGLLSDNNRLSELGRILGKFEEIVADQRGEVKAVVTTAEVRAVFFIAARLLCGLIVRAVATRLTATAGLEGCWVGGRARGMQGQLCT